MKKFILIFLSIVSIFVNAQNIKIQNCFVAAALGDALGRVTEFIESTNKIFKKYPNGVRTYNDFLDSDFSFLPAKFQDGKIIPYTDDTAMAILVMQVLVNAKKLDYDLNTTMSLIAKSFVFDAKNNTLSWIAPFRAPGLCCKKYVLELVKLIKAKQTDELNWWKVSPANGKTGGCGSVMRAYPFGLVFFEDPEKAESWAAEHSCITHGDYSSQAACAALATGIAYCMQNKDHEFILDAMINSAQKYDKITADKMKNAVECARKLKTIYSFDNLFDDLGNSDSYLRKYHDKFFSKYLGWSAQDAIAGAIYLFTLFPNDVEKAVYLGVHTPGDSDSIASLAGALSGAYSSSFDSNNKYYKRLEGYNLFYSFAKIN